MVPSIILPFRRRSSNSARGHASLAKNEKTPLQLNDKDTTIRRHTRKLTIELIVDSLFLGGLAVPTTALANLFMDSLKPVSRDLNMQLLPFFAAFGIIYGITLSALITKEAVREVAKYRRTLNSLRAGPL